MRILTLSDLHGHLPEPKDLKAVCKKINLILLAGDYPKVGAVSTNPQLELQKEWFQAEFAPWLEDLIQTLGAPAIGVAGNHDFLAEYPWGERILRKMAWTYLRHQYIDIKGLRVYGTPWTPRHPNYPLWAFQKNDEQIRWEIPQCDILLVHGPPHGFADKVDDTKVGSRSLLLKLEYQQRMYGKSPIVICGHIHENMGMFEKDGIKVINASMVTVNHALRGKALIFDTETGETETVLFSKKKPKRLYLIDSKEADSNLEAERFKL